jgi:hypothetical protein
MEDKDIGHHKMLAIRSNIKKANEEKRLESCRRRLDKIITTKIRTSFIGALSKFEDSFGVLWGQGKHTDSLTDEEKEMRELWEQTRTAVLNNGNSQLRAAQNEIQNHVVSWNRHQLDFVVRPKDGKEESDA